MEEVLGAAWAVGAAAAVGAAGDPPDLRRSPMTSSSPLLPLDPARGRHTDEAEDEAVKLAG